MKKFLITLVCTLTTCTSAFAITLEDQNITIQSGDEYLDAHGHYETLPKENFVLAQDSNGYYITDNLGITTRIPGLTENTKLIYGNHTILYVIVDLNLYAVHRDGSGYIKYTLPKTFDKYLANDTGLYGYSDTDNTLTITKLDFKDNKIKLSDTHKYEYEMYTISYDDNLWYVKDKEVFKITDIYSLKKYDLNETYTALKVANDNDIVLWDKDSMATSIVTSKEGWELTGDNKYNYYLHGIKLTNYFANLDGNDYYFDSTGTMRTGWVKLKDAWYYFKEDGSLKRGWLKYNDHWYYFKEDGSMASGWIKDNGVWYYLNNDGTMHKGWLKLDNKYYYLKDTGALATNTVINGFAVDSSGAYTV